MTDYAATLSARNTLLQSAIMQLESKRHRMGKQDGDDVELIEREEALVMAFEMPSRIKELEKELRDSESAADVVRLYAKRLEAEVKRLKKLAPKEAK
jgi:hypothetical protein